MIDALAPHPWISGTLVVRCRCGRVDLVERADEVERFLSAHAVCAPAELSPEYLVTDDCDLTPRAARAA